MKLNAISFNGAFVPSSSTWLVPAPFTAERASPSGTIKLYLAARGGGSKTWKLICRAKAVRQIFKPETMAAGNRRKLYFIRFAHPSFQLTPEIIKVNGACKRFASPRGWRVITSDMSRQRTPFHRKERVT